LMLLAMRQHHPHELSNGSNLFPRSCNILIGQNIAQVEETSADEEEKKPDGNTGGFYGRGP